MERLIILVDRFCKSLCNDQIFFQSSTSRPFYTSRQWDWSACGIPALSVALNNTDFCTDKVQYCTDNLNLSTRVRSAHVRRPLL